MRQNWAEYLRRNGELFWQAAKYLTHCTHRDIYYRDVPLFKTQRVVDSVRLNPSNSSVSQQKRLKVGGWHCSNVHAWKVGLEHCTQAHLYHDGQHFLISRGKQRSSSKGLICGSGLSITLLSGEVICCNDTEVSSFRSRYLISSLKKHDCRS